MEAAHLAAASRRRTVMTAWLDPEHRPANGLVHRNFFAERPTEIGVADLTFVPTRVGFLFLAAMLDASGLNY